MVGGFSAQAQDTVSTFDEQMQSDLVEELEAHIEDLHEHYGEHINTLEEFYQTEYTNLSESMRAVYLDAMKKQYESIIDYYNDHYADYEKDEWHHNAPMGVYLGGNTGTSLKSWYNLDHASAGVPTRCDGHLLGNVRDTDPACSAAGYLDTFQTRAESQVGLQGGLTLGYAFSPALASPVTFRVEAEYRRSQAAGNQAVPSGCNGSASE